MTTWVDLWEDCDGTLSCGCPMCYEMHMEDERWVDIARER